MKYFKYNPFLILMIVIGLGASLAVNVMRYGAERANRQVDLAIDYESLLTLAEMEGLPPSRVLADAKDAGITSLAVYETTFKKLNVNGKTTATRGSDILERYESGSLVSPDWRRLVESGEIVGTEIYVTGRDETTYREVREDLIYRLGPDRVRPFTVDGHEALAVKANWKSFEKMNIGMPTDEMRAVNEAGFYVIARPSNYTKVTEKDIKHVFSRLDGIKVSEIVFSGTEALGSPRLLNLVIDECRARNITLGGIEAPTQLQYYKQDGLLEMAQGYDYRLARLYSVPKDEMPKIKMDVAVERWANTDEERNIRIDLLHLFEKPLPDMTLYETNMKYIRDTRDILLSKGFSLGPASWFEPFEVSPVLRSLVMLGVAAAGVLYMSLVIPALNERRRLQYLLWLAASVVMAVPVMMGHGNTVRVLAALASANLFPAIAVIMVLDIMRRLAGSENWSLGKLIACSIGAFTAAGLVSFVGAAHLSGALSDLTYFLEINIFRGVKLTFVMPLVLVAIAFLQRFDIFDGSFDDDCYSDENVSIVSQVKRLMKMKVTMRTLIVLGAMAVAGIIFIARSGHNMGMPVSSLEIKLRAFLEQSLYARPRSKELFIGHPAFFVAMYAWARKWPTIVMSLCVLALTIGQGSMVETFAHMRTPVIMSFARGIGGMVGGAAIGVAAMAVIGIVERAWKSQREKIAD